MSKYKVEKVRSAARGKWASILNCAGLNSQYLSGEPGPCPFCRDGEDRWVFDDKDGNGTGFCRQCDATGDGFHLTAKILRLDIKSDFAKVLEFVSNQVGYRPIPEFDMESENAKLEFIRKIWNEATPLSNINETVVERYLASRGISSLPAVDAIRFRNRTAFYQDSKYVGVFPAMIASVVDAEGNLIGIHRTYLTDKGTKAPIDPTKKVIGSMKGGAIRLYSEVDSVIGVSEGIETALSVVLATNMPMIAAPSGSVMKSVPIPKSVRVVHIWADLDRNHAGNRYATQLAERLFKEGKKVYFHIPSGPIPKDKKSLDWNDVLQNDGADQISSALKTAVAWRTPADPNWASKPRGNLPSLLTPVPKLETEMIPEPLRVWITDLSERMQLPAEFFAGCALAMLGSAIGRRCGIYPMQRNDWLVVPCLWGGLIAPPSVMKTPAMSAALAPLRSLEAKTAAKFQEQLKKHNQEVEEKKHLIDSLNVKLKRSSKDGIDNDDWRSAQDQIKKIKAELERNRPWQQRYSTNDSTTEKLGEILMENPEGIFVFRDELYGFLKTLEKQGREADRTFYLESWNGLGSFTFDRIGRGTVHIPALCVSIFGGIQPDRLKDYFSHILEGSSGDDGFLSRFQILLYPDLPKSYNYTDRDPNVEARFRVNKIIERITESDFRNLAPEFDEVHQMPVFRFSEDAHEIFKTWFETHQRRLLSAQEDPAFISHLGKYRSLFPALALIFHIVEYCESPFIPKGVSENSVRYAQYWVEFLEKHALRVYGQFLDADLHAAHSLAKKIMNGKLGDGQTVRDLYRNGWSGLKTPETVRSGLLYLEKLGWLQVQEVSPTGVGAPSEIIKLHNDFVTPKKGDVADE